MYFGGIPLVSAINYKGMEWYSGIADTPQISSIKTYLSYSGIADTPQISSIKTYLSYSGIADTPQISSIKTYLSYSGIADTPQISSIKTYLSYSGIADTPQISSIKTYLSCEKPRPHARNDSVANYKRKDQMTVAKTHKCYIQWFRKIYSLLHKYVSFMMINGCPVPLQRNNGK